VLDFLAASQILGLLCILHYAFVQFFLNKEAAKVSILKKMGKNGVPKALKELEKADFNLFEVASEHAASWSRPVGTSSEGKHDDKLSPADCALMAQVSIVFKRFDSNGGGSISSRELQLGLRSFGKYFTFKQTQAVLDSYYSSMGSSLEKNPEMNIFDFTKLLATFDKFEPLDDLNAGIHSAAPTAILDFYGRVLYPLVYAGKSIGFILALNYYCGNQC